jgi:hypothetical protein
MTPGGAGECTRFMSEEFRIGQLSGEGRAVDGFPGLFLPAGLGMNPSCDDLLSHACFSFNQDGGVRCGEEGRVEKDSEHGWIGRNASLLIDSPTSVGGDVTLDPDGECSHSEEGAEEAREGRTRPWAQVGAELALYSSSAEYENLRGGRLRDFWLWLDCTHDVTS